MASGTGGGSQDIQETIANFLANEQNMQYLLDPGDDSQSTFLAVSSESADGGTSQNEVTYIQVVKGEARTSSGQNESVLTLYYFQPPKSEEVPSEASEEIQHNTEESTVDCGLKSEEIENYTEENTVDCGLKSKEIEHYTDVSTNNGEKSNEIEHNTDVGTVDFVKSPEIEYQSDAGRVDPGAEEVSMHKISNDFRGETTEADGSVCPQPAEAGINVSFLKNFWQDCHFVCYCEVCRAKDSSQDVESCDKVPQDVEVKQEVIDPAYESTDACVEKPSEDDDKLEGSRISRLCAICGDGFLQQSELASHMQLTHGEEMEEVAEESFSSLDDENLVEDIKPVVGSLLIKTEIPEPVMLPEHIQSPQLQECYVKLERLLECEICKLIVPSYSDFKEHLTQMHNNQFQVAESVHECGQCHKTFMSKKSLKRHCNNVHGKLTGRNAKTEPLKQKHRNQPQAAKLIVPECGQCGKTFMSRKSLKRHCNNVHGEITGGIVKTEHVEQKPQSPPQAAQLVVYECGQCNKTFKVRKSLRRHCNKLHSDLTGGKANTELQGFKCGQCGLECRSVKVLALHRRKQHFKLKETQCRKCEKIFDTYDSLLDHTVENTCCKCPECPAVLSHKSKVRSHIKYIHHMEKTHKCPHCPAVYKWGRQLKIHLRTHTGERPFVCPKCQKGFNVMGTLRKHMKTHNRESEYHFVCETCGSKFIERAVLLRHSRVHTKEKPFKCHICSSAHSTGSALKIHIRTHTGEKPYMCSECGRGFIAYSCLKLHLKSRHGMSLKINKYEVKVYK